MPSATPTRPGFRIALLFYGALNAILYAGLLPLWDGFDEPFHYGYVQYLRTHGSLPVLGHTVLSGEIIQSLDLVPASYAVQINLRRGVTFDTYFALPKIQRIELRRKLEQVDTQTASAPSQSPNYEAHQAPLAYALLAPFDALWAHAPLTVRILRLRLIGALLSMLLLWLATFRLARLMRLPESIPLSVMFVVFSSQMLYATICHVDNDWLAVPLWTLLLCEAVALYLQPKAGTAIRLALWLAAGLLTKAYFLCAVPLVFALVVLCSLRRRLAWRYAAACTVLWLGVAAPWYARNLVLYGNLTGMQETAGGIPFAQLAGAAARIPWLRAALSTARSSLWTGNNSLFTLSSKTVNLMLLLMLGATCLYVVHAVRRRLPAAERPLLAGVLCFVAGLVYSTVLTSWSTHGAGISPAPWYVQPLLAPGLCLLFIGLSELEWLGSLLHLAILWLWAYVIAATYVAKLIPFYAGFTTSQARLADLPGWWGRLFNGAYGTLDTAALLPPGVLLAMTAAVVTVAVTLAAALSVISCRSFFLPPSPFRWTLKN
jgi:hypothetical protein